MIRACRDNAWPGRTRRTLATLMVFGASCLAAPPTPGAETLTPTSRAAREIREAQAERRARGEPDAWIDRLHDDIYFRIQDFVERTDHRFATHDRTLLPVPATPFRIGVGTEVRNESGGARLGGELDIDVLLRMPNIESRLGLFITSEDPPDSPRQFGAHDTSVRLGLRYNPKRVLDFDVGVRVDAPPVAFTSLRWLRNVRAGEWDLQPFVKTYIESGEGFGVAGGITFDHWRDHWLLRASSYLNWSDVRDATEWTQTLMLAHATELIRFGRYSSTVRGRDLAGGAALQLLASGERPSSADTYEVALQFKRGTQRRWLFWYVTPFVRWEHMSGWATQIGIRAGFDALFWDLSYR